MTNAIQTVKHYEGCYRVRSEGCEIFGQIYKVDRMWHAEIRYTHSGEMIQYAGIWSRKADAVEECAHHIARALR